MITAHSEHGKDGEDGMKEIIIAVPDRFGETLEPEKVNAEIKREIVRCKDCKWGEPGKCGGGIDCDGCWHDDDWFCADGERR